jgi:hypothetical protein
LSGWERRTVWEKDIEKSKAARLLFNIRPHVINAHHNSDQQSIKMLENNIIGPFAALSFPSMEPINSEPAVLKSLRSIIPAQLVIDNTTVRKRVVLITFHCNAHEHKA